MSVILDLIYPLFINMLNHGATVSCVVLAVIAARFLLLKVFGLPRKYAYILWGIVAIRMFFVLPISTPVSIFDAEAIGNVTGAAFVTEEATGQLNEGLVASGGAPEQVNAGTGLTGGAPEQMNAGFESSGEVVGQVSEAAVSANGMPMWEAIVSTVWLVGVMVLFSYMIYSFYKINKTVETAVRLDGNVYQCNAISGPFVFGMLQPRIYLPFGMKEEEQSYVLAHEKIHIKRKDHWVKYLAFGVVSIFWIHPLLWVAYGLAMSDMEMSVDEAVLARMGSGVKKEYCEALLSVATAGGSLQKKVAGPLFFGESAASGRIKNVLRFQKPKWWMAVIGIVVIGMMVLVCLTAKTDEGEGVFSQENTVNTYITIEDTQIEHAYFTMTVPEDFIGKVSYAVIVEEPGAEVESANTQGVTAASTEEDKRDYRILFVLDELAFAENPSRNAVRELWPQGTLGGIYWWTIDSLGWLTEEEKAECATFLECYQKYKAKYAIGPEGHVLQSAPDGSGGYCEVNPTDVQWNPEVEGSEETYLHYLGELEDARWSFRSRMLEQ